MEKHVIRRSMVCLAAVLCILPLGGCLVYNSDVSYSGKGRPLSDNTLDQIERGTTTKDWVLSTLGEPSHQSTRADGTEILEYRYGKKRDNHFVLMPFVIIKGGGENKQTVYFEVSNGIVKNYWKEISRH